MPPPLHDIITLGYPALGAKWLANSEGSRNALGTYRTPLFVSFLADNAQLLSAV